VTLCAVVWGLVYAGYRAYYGLGGDAGMIGVPASRAEFESINLAAAAILTVIAVVPALGLAAWRHARLRRLFLLLCGALAAGLVMHGVVDDVQRVLSLLGLLDIHYPASAWRSVDRHAADLQDLAFNETWFIGEGMLFAAIMSIGLPSARMRVRWISVAVIACALLTAIGLLSALGVLGRVVI
jgi:hypothetical protein